MGNSISSILPGSLFTFTGHLAFLSRVVPAARGTEARYGVPKEVTLGQVLFESSWGISTLAVKANNFFGIMHTDGDNYGEYIIESGEVVFGQAQEVMKPEDFREYKSPRESFDDHGRLLSTVARYARAMVVRNNWRQFLIEIMNAGYSTDRPELCTILHCIHYAQRINNAVLAYRFFDERALRWYETGIDPGPQTEA